MSTKSLDKDEIWHRYYQKALRKKPLPRTERACALVHASEPLAIDCGCGTGADTAFLLENGYFVHALDINPEAISLCNARFEGQQKVELSTSNFEDYDFPNCHLFMANHSLYFANPGKFVETWTRIQNSIVTGGVFCGDLLGAKDSWVESDNHVVTGFTKPQVLKLFDGFQILNLQERNEFGKTAVGFEKHWHTFSVLAVKTG